MGVSLLLFQMLKKKIEEIVPCAGFIAEKLIVK